MLKAEEQMELAFLKKHGASIPGSVAVDGTVREIKERGYEGGETRVKLLVRGLTPLPAALPAVRFETTPGHQMQADWATVGRGADKLSLFIATLGWSRQAYVEFCDDERVETLIGCHETAFLSFGGVPIEVLYDNMKTVVIERNTYRLGVPRLCAARAIPAAIVSAISRADEGQGRTLHRLSEAQLLGSVCCVDAPSALSSLTSSEVASRAVSPANHFSAGGPSRRRQHC